MQLICYAHVHVCSSSIYRQGMKDVGGDRMVGTLGNVVSPFRPTSRKKGGDCNITIRRWYSSVPTSLPRSQPSLVLLPMQDKTEEFFLQRLWTLSAGSDSPPSGLSRIWASPTRHLWHYFFRFWPLVQTLGRCPTVGSFPSLGKSKDESIFDKRKVENNIIDYQSTVPKLDSTTPTRNEIHCSRFRNVMFLLVDQLLSCYED